MWVDLLVANLCCVDQTGELVRLCLIAYSRKSCLDFLQRVESSYAFSDFARQWWDGLSPHRRGFSPSNFFSSIGDIGMIGDNALVSLANGDKSVWLSSFVDIFFHLENTFRLSIEEAIEVLYPICLVVEPYKYHMVLTGWIQ